MASHSTPSSIDPVPLCVDLDGTLIKSDMLWESFVRLMRQNPLSLLAAPFWLLRGRACLKDNIARRVTVDSATLPYHAAFLDHVQLLKRQARPLVLATASDMKLAKPIADHVGVFDEVLASDGTLNLRGQNKLTTLTERYGPRGFDYAGNSSVDLAVWRGVRKAVVVNSSSGLVKKARQLAEVSDVFPRERTPLAALVAALRPHQWVKNLIVFLPLIASHQLTNTELLLRSVLTFVAFCLCASALYLLNDLLDLDADRQHPTKCRRPFAAGDLPISAGLNLIPLLLAGGFLAAAFVDKSVLWVLTGYVAAVCLYSWWLKRVFLVDALILAGFYTIRLVAGHEATHVPYSPWLLSFSLSLFLCLALLKRFQELVEMKARHQTQAKGRGYTLADINLVAVLGLISGGIATVVLALYVKSDQVLTLYTRPALLLLACPFLLAWLVRLWRLAKKDALNSDPVAFALRDPFSYATVVLGFVLVWLAS